MKLKILLICALFFIIKTAAAQGAAIVLKNSDVYISNEKIYLGDIADFTNASPEEIEQLKVLYIKRAAVPGFKAVVEKEYVANKAAKSFPQIKVEGPLYINVYTSKGSVSREDVEKTAKDYVLTNMPWQLDAAEIKVRQVKGSIPVTDGTVLLKVKDEGNFSYKGNIVIPVELHVDGRFARIEPVSMVIKVNAPCAVAVDAISRHGKIGYENITMETKEITFLPAVIITDLAFFDNKTPVRNILKGTILTSDMFEDLPLFRRGAPVDVIVQIRAVRVQAEGTALSDGRQGQMVRVKLITGKTVEGKVDSSGKVIIER